MLASKTATAALLLLALSVTSAHANAAPEMRQLRIQADASTTNVEVEGRARRSAPHAPVMMRTAEIEIGAHGTHRHRTPDESASDSVESESTNNGPPGDSTETTEATVDAQTNGEQTAAATAVVDANVVSGRQSSIDASKIAAAKDAAVAAGTLNDGQTSHAEGTAAVPVDSPAEQADSLEAAGAPLEVQPSAEEEAKATVAASEALDAAITKAGTLGVLEPTAAQEGQEEDEDTLATVMGTTASNEADLLTAKQEAALQAEHAFEILPAPVLPVVNLTDLARQFMDEFTANGGCRDLPYVDDDGFGCAAYDAQCQVKEAEGNLSHIPFKALESCCKCGGGETPDDKEWRVSHMNQNTAVGEAHEPACSWVVVKSGDHAWQCKDGMFVICSNDDECRTEVNIALLGGPNWVCHQPDMEEEGLCIPDDDVAQVLVQRTVPAADESSYFVVGSDGLLEETHVSNTSHTAPCCCGKETKHADAVEAQALLQEAGPTSSLGDLLTQERKAAAELNSVLHGTMGLDAPRKLAAACEADSHAVCSCPTAPPVVTVRFRVVSSNGVGLSNAVFRNKAAFDPIKELHKGEPCFGEACVGVREKYDGGVLQWDPQENVAEMGLMQTHMPLPADPELPRPRLSTPPTPVSCEEGGGHCEQDVLSYVLFLVDMSASAAQHTKDAVVDELTQMYTTLCSPPGPHDGSTSGTMSLESIPQHKQCGVYAFDGRPELHPIHALPAKPVAGEETMEHETDFTSTMLRHRIQSFKVVDNSTNLFGALDDIGKLIKELPRRNMTSFTVVLATDGQERAERMSKAQAEKVVSDQQDVNYYVLYMKPAKESPSVVAAESFLCGSVMRSENDHCCTSPDGGGDSAHQCAVVESMESVTDELEIDEAALVKEGVAAKDMEAKVTADFQHELSKRTDEAEAEQDAAVPITAGGITVDAEVTAALADSNGTAATTATVKKLTRHALAEKISANLKVEFQLELQVVAARLKHFKDRQMKHEFSSDGIAKRKEDAELRYENNRRLMLASWRRHVKVTQSLFKASHYQLGFCSSFRASASEDETDARSAMMQVHSDQEETQTDLKFSSRTFRNSYCTRETVLAAMGRTPDFGLLAKVHPKAAETQSMFNAGGATMAASSGGAGSSLKLGSSASTTTKKAEKAAASQLLPALSLLLLALSQAL